MKTESIDFGEQAHTETAVSTAVTEAVAEEADVDPIALPPLYEWVDADALDAVFQSTPTGTQRSGEIEFTYCGYAVTIVWDDEPAVTVTESPTE